MATENHRSGDRVAQAAVQVWRDGDRTVVGLFGEHDLGTETELSDAFARCCRRGGVGDVVVDLSEASFIDSSTVHALLGGRALVHGEGRNLVLRAPSSQARHVLDLCRLTGLFDPAAAGMVEGPRNSPLPTAVDDVSAHRE